MARTHTDASAAPLAEHERVLAWCPVRGMHSAADEGGGLLAADSWLVRDGRVRGIGRHGERFMNACSETAAVPADQVREFWREALAAVPRHGHWFPRVELGADEPAQLRLRLRPAPPLASQVRVWVSDRPDPRSTPRRKGPDLPALARLRQEAVGHGAQEALLSSVGGLVLEAASSSLLWWEDGTLCLPAPALPTLPGVTTSLIQERARSAGTPVVHRHPTLDDLDGLEVWLVNALHGIRPVTAWTGRALRAGPATRAAEWRRWLDGLGLPL
ncbi:aminotransferase class IV [Actinomadura vinacea]|uniref:Aminotransferase class IV n=1 Tax=Actinomadura vinacea TaxID=115336 RepID=A0ABN3ICK9_9ACTN